MIPNDAVVSPSNLKNAALMYLLNLSNVNPEIKIHIGNFPTMY